VEGNTRGRGDSVLETIEKARKVLEEDKSASPAVRAMFELLISIIQILVEQRHPKTSKNSSTPPSMDPNRKKEGKKPTGKEPGGQPGHKGTCLEPVDNPDQIIPISVDRGKLPGGEWKAVGVEKRQMLDFKTIRYVVEYQAEILENEKGERVTADFPEGVTQKAQYGSGTKAKAVYDSCYQMIPCARISDEFGGLGIPLSAGSVWTSRWRGMSG
jgi:transposase